MGEQNDDNLKISVLREIDHVQGDRNAKVILTQYGSYQCPRSGQAYANVQKLLQQLNQQFCFVYRHFPQSEKFSQAQKAAETAEAAAAQNKFWEMHNVLFENQYNLEDSHLVEYAVLTGLDIPTFLRALSNHLYTDRVQLDIDLGLENGVKHTPTFFISVCHQGSHSLESLLTAILEATAGLPNE